MLKIVCKWFVGTVGRGRILSAARGNVLSVKSFCSLTDFIRLTAGVFNEYVTIAPMRRSGVVLFLSQHPWKRCINAVRSAEVFRLLENLTYAVFDV